MTDITINPGIERARREDIPRPPAIGFFRRWHVRLLGFGDRFRYRNDVADGAHTHLTRWIDGRSNRGIARLERWSSAQVAPIDRELATLSVEPVLLNRPAPAPTPPSDPKDRVRWNDEVRRHSEAQAEDRRRAAAGEAARRRAAELRATRDGITDFVETTRREWIAYYEELANAYSRQRIGRRGLRPAPEAVTPAHDELAPRYPLEGPAGR
jgi:hypothetical protein